MKLSVVVPAYNEEKLIGKCLDAILNQSLPRNEYEVILVDNNSTDNTAQIAKKRGVRVVSYTKHKSAIWAKQFGVEQAKGEIVAVTDADAIPERTWLENILNLLEKDKIQCVGGTVQAESTNKFAIGLLKFFDQYAQLNQLVGIPFIWGSNMGFRKSAFKKVGGFNTSLKTGDDWEFAMKVQQKFGRRSVVYTKKLRVKASARKQEKMSSLIPYVGIGCINFFTIFILRKSYTVGNNPVVR